MSHRHNSERKPGEILAGLILAVAVVVMSAWAALSL